MANIQSIIITNAIGLVLLVGLFVSSTMMRSRRGIADRILTFDILVCAGGCVCEALTWIVDGQPGMAAYLANLLGNSYCYLATSLYPYLWVLYVDLRLSKAERIERRYKPLLVSAVTLALLIVANIPGQFVFAVSADNVYQRLPLGYIYYVSAFASLFFSVYLRNKYQRELGTAHFFSVWLFLLPVLVGALLQALFFGLSLAWTSICMGLTLTYMSEQNELSYIDALTGLYNRTYLDYALGRMRDDGVSHGGIMVDLDFFKAINDSYGHSAGDEALCQAARILVQATPRTATVARYAGDEFIVLARRVSEEGLEQIAQDIQAQVAAFNASGMTPWKLSFSLGASTFDAKADSVDDFLRRIDERMYECKREKHGEGAR